MCIIVLQQGAYNSLATVRLSLHVFGQASTYRITGTWHPWLGLHMQVHKLIIDLLRNVTSYTALFSA